MGAKEKVLEQIESNKEFVRKQREELKILENMRKEEEMKRLSENQERFEIVNEMKKYARISVAELHEKNKKIAQDIVEERKINQETINQEKMRNLEQKRKIIAMIQEMERIASERAHAPRYFDPNTTANFGLLCEMSLVDLHKKLKKMEKEHKEEVELKRKNIVSNKSKQQDKLKEMMNNIQSMRNSRAKEKSEIKTFKKLLKTQTLEELQERHKQKMSIKARIQRKRIEKEAENKALAEE